MLSLITWKIRESSVLLMEKIKINSGSKWFNYLLSWNDIILFLKVHTNLCITVIEVLSDKSLCIKCVLTEYLHF